MSKKINIIKQKIDNYLNAPKKAIETEKEQGYREALVHIKNDIALLDLMEDIDQLVMSIESKFGNPKQ
jgi:phosphoglycerate-specific signal transduction histidine kinase